MGRVHIGTKRTRIAAIMLAAVMLIAIIVAAVIVATGSASSGKVKSTAANTEEAVGEAPSSPTQPSPNSDSSPSSASTSSPSPVDTLGGYPIYGAQLSTAMPALAQEAQLNLARSLVERTPDDPLSLGALDAPVVMVQFSDFSCPMCSKFMNDSFPALQKYVEDGTLRIEYHDFVIFEQYHSDLAAQAAWAAGQQGRFWEFVVAASQRSLNEHWVWDSQSLTAAAQEAGIPDMNQFEEDRSSDEAASSVQENTELALHVGFSGTPAFVINNRVVSGAVPASVFEATVEAALADVVTGRFSGNNK